MIGTPERLSSSRQMSRRMPSARPGSVRPTTGLRPTTTGLLMPKSSRGKTAASLRRQVHDKSYWMAVLTAKTNELQAEINRLGRASEQLQKEQARSGFLKQSAEQSARDLHAKNQALIVLNEYFERFRLPDASEDVKDEIQLMQSENIQLAEHLESLYAQKQTAESILVTLNQSLSNNRTLIANLRRKFDETQQKKFIQLEQTNRSLVEQLVSLNAKLSQLKRVQKRLERTHSAEGGSLQRRELLHTLKRVWELQQQADDLKQNNRAQAPEAKKFQIIAEAKMEKQRVDSLLEYKSQLSEQIDQINRKLETYDQPDTLAKINELTAKRTMMNDFIKEYDSVYESTSKLIQELGNQINSETQHINRISRQIKHLQIRRSAETTDLLAKWRTLKKDLDSIRQLEGKAETELNELVQMCQVLQDDLQRFERVEELRDSLNMQIEQQKKFAQTLNKRQTTEANQVKIKQAQLKEIANELDQDELANRLIVLESKLLQLQISKRTASDKLRQFDYTDIKLNALQSINKLNQRLLGF